MGQDKGSKTQGSLAQNTAALLCTPGQLPRSHVPDPGETEPPPHCPCLHDFSRKLHFSLKSALCMFSFYFRLQRRRQK